MQLYLCEKYDKDHKISFPYDSDEYWETVEWLVWMVSAKSACTITPTPNATETHSIRISAGAYKSHLLTL